MSESKTYEQMVELVERTLGEGYTVERDELSGQGTWVITSPIKEDFDVTPFLGTPGGDLYAESPDKFEDAFFEEYGWYDSQWRTMGTKIEDYNDTERNNANNRLMEMKKWRSLEENGVASEHPNEFTALAESYGRMLEFIKKYSLLEEDRISEWESEMSRVFGVKP